MDRLEHLLSFISAVPRIPSNFGQEKDVPLAENGQLTFAADDMLNPKNWSLGRKCYLTGVAIGISDDLRVSVEAAGLVTTLFLLGYCAGSLFWAPLSEFYGRRWLFCISFTIYVVLNFLCAFTPNFGGLLSGRSLTATTASSILSNGPGLIADIWGPVGRGNSMAIFMVTTFCGPALGPVVAGFLQVTNTWRWCSYALLCLGGFTKIFVFTIPETLPKVVLAKKAERLRKHQPAKEVNVPISGQQKESLSSIFKTALTRPWIILFDPISFLVAIYYSVVYTLLYGKEVVSSAFCVAIKYFAAVGGPVSRRQMV